MLRVAKPIDKTKNAIMVASSKGGYAHKKPRVMAALPKEGGSEETRLVVGGFPTAISVKDVQKIFEIYGDVGVEMKHNRALVTFQHAKEAERAISYLNGRYRFARSSRPIYVRYDVSAELSNNETNAELSDSGDSTKTLVRF